MAFASCPTDPQYAEEPMYEKCPACAGIALGDDELCLRCGGLGEVIVDAATLAEREGLDEADRAWSERQ
ncbi:hypothetical protein M0R72_10935 [Candidatus Pacearchaeota archaeon]|jgi:hypothetical protein|nr:hypothetical protein [Candidatus Pacearchaeota archaeon]